MSIEQNKQVVLRLFDEVYNQGDLSAIDDIIGWNVVGHDPTGAVPIRGIDGYRQAAVSWRDSFPDLKVSVDDVVAEGDRVAARWTLIGHHLGAFMDVPPTGREVNVGGIIIYRFAGGKIIEYWGVFDTLHLMRQLGAIGS